MVRHILKICYELLNHCSMLWYISYSVPSILRSNRYRRDAKALEEDEEMWFNEEEEDEGKTVVASMEKSKSEDDFPDSYEKFMETKKGIFNFCLVFGPLCTQELVLVVLVDHMGCQELSGFSFVAR